MSSSLTNVSSMSSDTCNSKKRTADDAHLEPPEKQPSKRTKTEGDAETSTGMSNTRKRTDDNAQNGSSISSYTKRVKREADADVTINEFDSNTSVLRTLHRIHSESYVKREDTHISEGDIHLQRLEHQLGQEQLKQEDLNTAAQPPFMQWANPKLSFKDLEASGAASRIMQPAMNDPEAFKAWLERRYVSHHADRGSPLLQYLLEASEEMPEWRPQFTQSWDYLTVFLSPREDHALHEARHDKRLVYQCSLGEEPLYGDLWRRDDEYQSGESFQKLEQVAEITLEPEVAQQHTQLSDQPQAHARPQIAPKKPQGRKSIQLSNGQYSQRLRSGAHTRKFRSGEKYSAPASGHIQLGWTGRQERC